MADITGGSLSFTSILDNGQMDKAIEETLRRLQGLSGAVAGTGDTMDETTREMLECIETQKRVIGELEGTVSDLNARIASMEPGGAQDALIRQAAQAQAELDEERAAMEGLVSRLGELQSANASAATSFGDIRAMLAEIGRVCEESERELVSLEEEYERLGAAMDAAYRSGRDDELAAVQERRTALQGEIRVRRELLSQLRQGSDALEDEARRTETARKATEDLASAHVSLRTRIRDVRQQMADMRTNGIDEQSEAYKRLAEELGKLQDIQSDIQKQGTVLSNDERQFAGMIAGLQGVVGGFTAAQSAMALFGEKNEELQQVMLKVQSLIGITVGLQQVAQVMNKDSAFSLTILTSAKEWWNKLLDIGRGKLAADTAATEADTAATVAQNASLTAGRNARTAHTAATGADTAAQEKNTAATAANTAGQGAETAAAVAGTAANITLAGAFRMVGAAIKSIPLFGWIAAALSALVAVIAKFASKAREARKEQEEWYSSIADNVYKPIGAVTQLSDKWNSLGDNLEAKRKFIDENRKAFEELGIAVDGVTEAESLLSSENHLNTFVEAQIKKAEALLYLQQAQDKVKELTALQLKYDSMDDTVKQWAYGTTEVIEVANKQKEKLGEKIQELTDEIKNGYLKSEKAQEEAAVKFRDAGVRSVETVSEGTIAFLEKAISERQALLKRLVIGSDEYNDVMSQLDALQSQLDGAYGRKSSSEDDPFLNRLAEYKAEYTRFLAWATSSDASIASMAQGEFAELLAQGSSYVEFLQNLRDEILSIDETERTTEQVRQLRLLYDAIAAETRDSLLGDFSAQLKEELSAAGSVVQAYNLIAEKRKELAGDGSYIDNAKRELLDEAQGGLEDSMREQTEALLEEYGSYIAKRRRIDEQYAQDMELLRQRREKAESDSEKAEIDRVIANRNRQYRTDTRGTGNVDYDSLLEEYRTYEQRQVDIAEEYAGKIALANEMGNRQLVESLERAESEALSHLAMEMLRSSSDWETLFGELDKVSTRELNRLVAKLRDLDGVYLGVEFDPEDLDTIMRKIEDLQDEVRKRNPFKALVDALQEYTKAEDRASRKSGMKKTLTSLSDSIDLLKVGFDSVVGGIGNMGIAMDDSTAEIIGGISDVLGGAAQCAEGIATMNPAAMIQGGISAITALIGLFSSDTRLEKKIEGWQDEVDALKNAYTQLSWEIDRALGTSVYNQQKEAISNLEQQKALMEQMISAEEKKKKTDKDTVSEYQEQIADLDREIQDLYDDIASDILQTTAKSFSDDLADALVSAFRQGEDAAEAFEDTVNSVLQNAVVNQFKKQFLEQQLQDALDELYEAMGHWEGDDFIFDGLTDAEIASFKDKVQKASDNFTEALETYKDLFGDLTDDSDTSLTGAVKGVSEETASIVAGQMNAIRINQLEATEVMRNALSALNTIAANTQYNRHLAKLEQIVSLLQSDNGVLRAQGLSQTSL